MPTPANPSIAKHLGRAVFSPHLFIGREQDLTAIHQKLFAPGSRQAVLVSGPGGIGKTSLAARYYHDHQDEYDHLAWVFVEHKLVDALLSLAPELGLTFAPTSPPEAR
ncbi:MAG: AAA family ATPase, partial [Bacteroidota bacterium]